MIDWSTPAFVSKAYWGSFAAALHGTSYSANLHHQQAAGKSYQCGYFCFLRVYIEPQWEQEKSA